jgi:aspartate-semialdehyde dehydrogenase
MGREVAAELLRAGHPTGLLALFGRREADFSWRGEALHVASVDGAVPQADLAFVCTEADLGARLVPALVARGTRVIDLSGASRGGSGAPLVLDGVNGHGVGAFSELVALPHRSSVALVRTLAALEASLELEEVDAFVVLAAASDGARGIMALREELSHGAGQTPPAQCRVGNLQPLADEALERALVADVLRVLGRDDLGFDLTGLRADAERCDAFAVRARTRRLVKPEEVAEILGATAGLVVQSEGAPCPVACAGSREVHVGRIRGGSRGPGSVCFFAVADQLRAGAAWPALQVASLLPATG